MAARANRAAPRRRSARRAPSAPRSRAVYTTVVDRYAFRAPGTSLRLGELVARAAPNAAEAARSAAIRGGVVRVDGRVLRDPAALVAPGLRVEVVLASERRDGAAARFALRARTDACAVLSREEGEGKGVDPEMAKLLREGLPVFAVPDETPGLRLVAFTEDGRARLRRALAASDDAREDHALVETPPWSGGTLGGVGPGADVAVSFERIFEREGVARLALRGRALDLDAVRDLLAKSGFPPLGDARGGGRLVPGGLRLAVVRLRMPEEGLDVFEPEMLPDVDDAVFPPDVTGGNSEASLVVSAATLRALARGHPWVIADRETGDATRYRAGSLVRLRGPRGEDGPFARIDGEGTIAARAWGPAGAPRGGPSVEARIAAALARRKGLLANANAASATDVFRLVHGEADLLPGLFVDRLAGCLRVLSTARACARVESRALDAIVHGLAADLGADPPVVHVTHLRSAPHGRLRGVELVRGTLPAAVTSGAERLPVRERGLRFRVDPGLSAPERPSAAFGFFPDQRENRARLAAVAPGGRWLNLFAHTGAFSVALLAAGAREVVSVDLSAAWLRWLEESLRENGLDAGRHRTIRSDARRALERLAPDERFDGIVLDPPTAAAAGRRFWSVRRDLAPLVGAALGRLSSGGRLLVTHNERGARRVLREVVERAATQAGVGLGALAEAPPGEDFPPLPGFPEGDPFEGVLAEVR